MKKKYQTPATATIALDKEVQPLALTMGTGGHTGGGGHAKQLFFGDEWDEAGESLENKDGKNLNDDPWND